MAVITRDGAHYVIIDGIKFGPYATSAAAWREHDLQSGEILNPQQGISDFRAKQEANRE